MEPNSTLSRSWLWLFGMAAVVIIIGGLKAVSPVITPFLLAAFLTIICIPPLTWMQRKGVPSWASFVLLFSTVGFSFFLLFLAIKGTSESLVLKAPLYQERLTSQLWQLRMLATEYGVPPEFIPATIPLPNVSTLTGLARNLAGAVGQFTAYTFFVLLVFMFLLLEERSIVNKVEAAFPNKKRGRVRARSFLRSVNRYLAIKTTSSFFTGLFTGLGLWAIGVDFPILWAVLTGVLNFIPTIGSIVAAIAPVLIAFLGLGIPEGLATLALYVVVNTAIGSIIEPRFMGQTLGLSPVVVLLSLMLWGWVLGPVGMLLSILLTMIVKLALESSPDTRWLGVLLSDGVRLKKLRKN
ncbi:MAG: AI-2E family transporter [Thiopseudomonas sp.]|nr:AI-2E family transporter [Thiopseudomonas sp.]